MNPYIGDLMRTMAGFAGRVTTGRQRRTISILNDLPEHILKDIGLARDWRGTIRRPAID